MKLIKLQYNKIYSIILTNGIPNTNHLEEKMKRKRELPSIGTVLQKDYKGKLYKAKIVKDETSKSGRAIKFNGKIYKTMSASAKAITKSNVNGWLFWKF